MSEVSSRSTTRTGGWRTLASLLDDGGPLPTDRVVQILRGLAEVLDGLHVRGTAYGALSPAAIQLDSDDRPGLLLIPDAQALLGSSTAYLAPEQRRGGSRVDGRADQYAVAVIAYELLSGRHRQEDARNGTPLATLNEVELVPGRSLRPGLRPGANDVLRRAISRDPEQRFATVGAFVAALAGQQVVAEAAAPSLVWRLPNPSVLVGGAAAIFIVAAGLSLATSPESRESVRLTAWSWTRTLSGWFAGAPSIGRVPIDPPGTRIQLPVGTPTLRVPGADPMSSPSPLPIPSTGTGRALPLPSIRVRSGAPGTSEPASAATGHLRVTVNDGVADVVIDGTVRGSTPYVGSATPGPHRVAVRAAGRVYEPASASITVGSGDTSTVVFARVEP